MNKFLQRIGLINYFTVTLPISRTDFVNRLSGIVEPGNPRPFSFDFANVFDKKEYFGEIDLNGFKIRKKNRLFQRRNSAIATGLFLDFDGQLTIETEINGYKPMMPTFLILALFMMIGAIVTTYVTTTEQDFFTLPTFFLFLLFFLAIPFYVQKRNIARLKYDLEREFVFIAKP